MKQIFQQNISGTLKPHDRCLHARYTEEKSSLWSKCNGRSTCDAQAQFLCLSHITKLAGCLGNQLIWQHTVHVGQRGSRPVTHTHTPATLHYLTIRPGQQLQPKQKVNISSGSTMRHSVFLFCFWWVVFKPSGSSQFPFPMLPAGGSYLLPGCFLATCKQPGRKIKFLVAQISLSSPPFTNKTNNKIQVKIPTQISAALKTNHPQKHTALHPSPGTSTPVLDESHYLWNLGQTKLQTYSPPDFCSLIQIPTRYPSWYSQSHPHVTKQMPHHVAGARICSLYAVIWGQNTAPTPCSCDLQKSAAFGFFFGRRNGSWMQPILQDNRWG